MSVLYKRQCGVCEKFYVGQTKKYICIRYKKHMRNIKNQETNKSHLAEEVLECNHIINAVQLLKLAADNQEINI